MIISTPRASTALHGSNAAGPRRPRGFTLLETMIAATLSAAVLAAVLSAFLMIGRTSVRSRNYTQLESETRAALEIFGEDARNASDVHWNSSSSITLTLPTATNSGTVVTYIYDNGPQSSTFGCFYRVAGSDALAFPRRVLARNVDAGFAFQRFKLDHTVGPGNEATSDAETKQLQVTLRSTLHGATTVAATQAAVSACYVLRNKRVSN